MIRSRNFLPRTEASSCHSTNVGLIAGPLLVAFALAALNAVGASSAKAIAKASSPINLTLSVDPKSPAAGGATTFIIGVKDRKGHPLSGAKVSASLVMTSMDMGKNIVDATVRGPGLYVGTGQFTMSGGWDVIVTAVKGSQKTTKTFPFTVK